MSITDTNNETDMPVPEHARGLLLEVAYGWTPAPLDFAPVKELRYGNADLSELVSQLRLHDERLVVTLGGPRLSARHGDLLPFNLDGQLNGTLVDGTTFHGELVLRVSHAGGFSKDSDPFGSFTIEAGSWTVVNGSAPSLWVGRVEGAKRINFSGNLIVERTTAGRPRMGHRGHFCLSGAYTYYLIQSGTRGASEWHLVIDTAGGVPDAELLGRDFLLLQFVLGRQLRIPELLGVTPDGRTSACITGTGTRKNLQNRAIPPVPIERNNDEWIDESWIALFFERVSVAWSKHPESRTAYWMAFDSYLDAMTLHLDADYLRLHIALEAFSYWLLRFAGQEERMVVKDKAAWKKWVKSNSHAIRELASEGFQDSLINKVMGVYRLSSGRVVPSAFLMYGSVLTSEMVEELDRRDVIVHQGLMAPDGYDDERDLQRIGIVRTMLVALVARAVDYGGAINGWSVGDAGYPEEPHTWWSVRDDDRRLAQRTFVAEKEVAA